MSKLLTVKILNLWKQPASTWIPYINAGTTIAYFHLLEKGKNPIEAIKASNDATCGNKWSLFGMTLLLVLIFYVMALVLLGIGALCQSSAIMLFMCILIVVAALLCVLISLAFRASIWKQLKDNVE